MKLDDTGRHAASVLEHEVHQQLDTARSLRELYDTVERPRRVRRRAKPLLVAFVSVIVVAAIAVLVGETRTSHVPSCLHLRDHPRVSAGRAPPRHARNRGGVVANQGPLPPGDPRGVTYGAYFGARPTLSVTTWTQSPPLGSVAAPAAAVDIRGHHGQLFSTRDWLGVTTYDLWWQEGSYTLQVEAFGLPLSHLRRFAASLRPIDQRHFRAAAHGIATPPTVGLSTPSFSVDDPSGPGENPRHLPRHCQRHLCHLARNLPPPETPMAVCKFRSARQQRGIQRAGVRRRNRRVPLPVPPPLTNVPRLPDRFPPPNSPLPHRHPRQRPNTPRHPPRHRHRQPPHIQLRQPRHAHQRDHHRHNHRYRRNRQDHQAPTLQVRLAGVARYDGGNSACRQRCPMSLLNRSDRWWRVAR